MSKDRRTNIGFYVHILRLSGTKKERVLRIVKAQNLLLSEALPNRSLCFKRTQKIINSKIQTSNHKQKDGVS